MDTCDGNKSPDRRGCLPSENDKINESVNKGSVFLALQSNFITLKSLLQWLTTVDISDTTCVAYKAVCTKIHPDNQYLDDGFHFLVKKPEYIPITLEYDFTPDIPAKKNSDDSGTVLSYCTDALTQFNGNKKLREFIQLIVSGDGSMNYIKLMLVTVYHARIFPHIRDFSAEKYNTALVSADWIERLRYTENLALLIIRRAAYLQKCAPLYYANVAYKAYHKVAEKLYKDKLLSQLTKDELATFNTFFPNIINVRVLEYSDLAYKIAVLGNDIAGYILGFPIQNMIPSDEQIHTALSKLKELGREGYIAHIKKYVRETYVPKLPFAKLSMVQNSDGVVFPNDTDIVYEDIDSYVPFDIIACQIGDHVHRFTRVEAENLLEKKKNHWTNEWLPASVLATIRSRVDAAKELGLPEANPLPEIFDKITNGTFFGEDSEDQSDDSQEEQVPSVIGTIMNGIVAFRNNNNRIRGGEVTLDFIGDIIDHINNMRPDQDAMDMVRERFASSDEENNDDLEDDGENAHDSDDLEDIMFESDDNIMDFGYESMEDVD